MGLSTYLGSYDAGSARRCAITRCPLREPALSATVAASVHASQLRFTRRRDLAGEMATLLLLPAATASYTDRYDSCYRWASHGSCEKLSSFMQARCCGSCKGTASDPCTPVDDTVGLGSIATTFARALTLDKYKPSLINSDPPIIVLDEFTTAAADIAASAERVGGFGSPGSSCAFNPSTCNSSSMSCLPVDGGA